MKTMKSWGVVCIVAVVFASSACGTSAGGHGQRDAGGTAGNGGSGGAAGGAAGTAGVGGTGGTRANSCASGEDCPGRLWCIEGSCQPPQVLWQAGKPLPSKMVFENVTIHEATEYGFHFTMTMTTDRLEIDITGVKDPNVVGPCAVTQYGYGYGCIPDACQPNLGVSTDVWDIQPAVVLQGVPAANTTLVFDGYGTDACTESTDHCSQFGGVDGCYGLHHCNYAKGTDTLADLQPVNPTCTVRLLPVKRDNGAHSSAFSHVNGLLSQLATGQGFLYSVACSGLHNDPSGASRNMNYRFANWIAAADCATDNYRDVQMNWEATVGSLWFCPDTVCTKPCPDDTTQDTCTSAAHSQSKGSATYHSTGNGAWRVWLQNDGSPYWSLFDMDVSYEVQ
jgi:hypothetical protein